MRRAAGLLICALLAWPALCEPAKPDAVTPDGGRYYGPLHAGKLHGAGRLEWTNGDVYEGGFVEGLMSGRGVLRHANGNRYEGEFNGGYMHGKGRYEVPEREVYQGEFRQGYYWGKGRYETPEGEVYEGDFQRGEFTGQGTLTERDGARYEGEFLKWRFHGKGRYMDADGNVYAGRFVNGVLDGPGTLKGPQGQSYEGEFKQWRFHGKGVLRLANGDVYKGEFQNGFYEGQGTLTYAKPRADGVAQETGVWRFGVLERQEERRKFSANAETALYNQSELLGRAIRSLKPRDRGRINLYLLAVAGDGSQEVFRREVEFVSRQFAERFGTGGRTLTLINSRATVDSAPMATRTSIRESIAALAARMDKQEDILFVFLTSHGSREHELTLAQNGIELPDLSAAELGRLLRSSGIRWRVIVVSACYSGGFIDALKDDGTLVITAARHDRTSFGCADENEFTYFGRAFFKEALPQAASFQDAFRKAELIVREMELRELKAPAVKKPTEVDHSLPQMHAPDPIARHLLRWWAQLR